MPRPMAISAALAVLALATIPALAQDAASLKVATSDAHGQYLTDKYGRALYLFTADTPGTTDAAPKVAGAGDCLVKWPPLYSAGAPIADIGADRPMVGMMPHDGNMLVTSNGWPLYYFFKGNAPGETKGAGVDAFGGEWYLVSPAGEKIDTD